MLYFFPQKNNQAGPAEQHGSANPRYKLKMSVITSVMSNKNVRKPVRAMSSVTLAILNVVSFLVLLLFDSYFPSKALSMGDLFSEFKFLTGF